MLLGVRRKVEALEGCADPRLDLGLVEPAAAELERELVPDARGEELLLGVLEHDADAVAEFALGELREVVAVDKDLAGAGRRDAGQGVEEGRLAGAVWADERGERARRQLERDAVK